MPLIEVVIPAPGLDSWELTIAADGSGADVLHLTPQQAMHLVEQLLDAVHEADPQLCCGETVTVPAAVAAELGHQAPVAVQAGYTA